MENKFWRLRDLHFFEKLYNGGAGGDNSDNSNGDDYVYGYDDDDDNKKLRRRKRWCWKWRREVTKAKSVFTVVHFFYGTSCINFFM